MAFVCLNLNIGGLYLFVSKKQKLCQRILVNSTMLANYFQFSLTTQKGYICSSMAQAMLVNKRQTIDKAVVKLNVKTLF